MRRLRLTNARRSFVLLLMRALVWGLLWAHLPAGLVALAAWGELAARVAAPDTIAVELGERPSVVTSARGYVVGGPVRGRGEWLELDAIGRRFVVAAVASEDARFFEHAGFDLRGVLRALRENVDAGAANQGGSGITQQLAKSFVGTERTLLRKIEELAVARQLEARFDKRLIFEAWANRAYFGAGATGIDAAAQRYFGVAPRDLTLAQAATLVARVRAPARYAPRRARARAPRRRDRVLDRIEVLGMASAAEVSAARAEPLVLAAVADRRVAAPEVAAAAFREAGAALGEASRHGGLAIATTVDLVAQRVAQRALREGLEALDRRQGLRQHLGAVALDQREAARAAIAGWPAGARLRPALVERVERDVVEVLDGERRVLPRAGWSWAVPFRRGAENHGDELRDARDAFEAGDLVLLDAADRVTQLPRVEGAFGSADLESGAMAALVGAYDPGRTDFDRFLQACRQPGSTFKPFVYSAALDAGLTVADIVRDTPIRLVLGPFEEWRPRNADGRFSGHMTVWEAFVWSRNLPLLAVQRQIGVERVRARAQALGILSDLAAVDSLGLGASCVVPRELLAAYGAFGRGGIAMSPFAVAQARDREGALRLRRGGWATLSLPPSARAGELWRGRDARAPRAVSRENAWIMTWLLREAVLQGTAMPLRDVGYLAAGKTGTTNAYDAWFAGLSARQGAVVWVGADRDTRALGTGESGAATALPIWALGLLPTPAEELLLPPAPPGLVFAEVSPETGLRGVPGVWTRVMPFHAGSEPRALAEAPERGAARRADVILRQPALGTE